MEMLINIPQLSELLERMEALELQNRKLLQLLQEDKPSQKEWYSIKEAAIFLGVSTATVRRLIARNLLKRSLATRHIKIPADSLREYREATVAG